MTTRREFLYAIGAAGTAASLNQAQDVFWEPEQTPNLGWTPGIEQHVRSTCLTCPGRCGIRGRVVDGKLVSIAGNRLHPMNRGGLCPRGVAGVQKLYHPERLEGPLMRTGERGSNGWRRLSTNGAITLIAERLTSLRESGNPASLGLLAGYCKGTMEDLWKQFLHAFGSPNYVADDYFDGTDAVMGLMHGIHKRPAYDLDNAELVVSFGAPLFESWWSPLQAFVAFAPPEAEAQLRPRFVQIDTRFSKTAARSQEWVGIRPGTHAVLALGIAYVLIRDSIFDRGFVERFVTGFEDFERGGRIRQGFRSLVMSNYRTEEVSAITGVPVGRITDLARMIGEVEQPVAICGADVMQSPRGLLAGMAVHSLNVLTGSVRRRGGVIFREDTPLATLVPPTIDAIATAGNRSERVGAMNPPMDHDVRADRFAQAVTAGTESPIEALFLYYANPLASTKHPALWVQALQRIPFVVSFSPFMDETSRQADLILPDLFPYERWQDAPAPDSYPYPVWSITRPLVEPHEGAINTGDAVLQLATAIGGTVAESLPYQTMEALLKDRARGLFEVRRGMVFGNHFDRVHQRQMEERGWWLPSHTAFDDFWNDLVEQGGWTDPFLDVGDPANLAATESGRIELMPTGLDTALESLDSTGSPYLDIVTPDTAAPLEYPLRLLPYKFSTLSSGSMRWERWLLEQPSNMHEIHYDPWVEVGPATARELDLAEGSAVWVVSRQGRCQARVTISSGTAPHTVCVPYGPVHADGRVANPLRLLVNESDPLTGLQSWFTTFVRLERAQGEGG